MIPLRIPLSACIDVPDQPVEWELFHGLGCPVQGGLGCLARRVRLVGRCRGSRKAGLSKVLLESIVERLILLFVGELIKDLLRLCW